MGQLLPADEVVKLMSHPCLRQLRTAADVGIVLFEDLANYEMPEGYSQEEIWRIFMAIRKQASVLIPDDPEREVDMWMVTTSALSFDAEMIEVRANKDSALARSLHDMQGSPFVTRFIERTLVRGMEEEGFSIDEGRVHELFTGSPAVTSTDRLVENYFRLSSECDRLTKRDVTHGLIETLYYGLIDGVDRDTLPARDLDDLDPRLAPPQSQKLMDLVCQRANDDNDDPRFGPVLRIINIMWFFRCFDILPSLNVLVGLLLRNVIAIKWGFPVLSWLPSMYTPGSGEEDMSPVRQKAVYDHWTHDCGYGFDFTPYFQLSVKMYLRELEKLASAVASLEQLNEQIERLFEAHINYRQKSILSALCREPEALLRIAPHQRTFRIAYGTARADFLSLEEAGYLTREQRGRAFVFRAHPKLREIIMQLGVTAMEW